ncbi:MAG TPA: 2Fe-2S iron-sulfur cluster-binding protein [Woeseiaceae bacterium]|nr:2Fe-2S iron-sulfur cluster-binding protein [Woeseiaceae bacterium]
MRRYYPLTVERLAAETADSRRIALHVPPELRDLFDFVPGQHLPVQAVRDGKRVRRTYSICSVPGSGPLEIGVRLQPGGAFSGFVAEELEVGDTLEVMPPFGQFHAADRGRHGRTCLMFAAGSGITPILSILRATLEREPHSRAVLFYGNRRQRTSMFIDDLYALKNRFTERLSLYFLFSQEGQEFPIFSGRLDAAKVRELHARFCVGPEPDEAFVCGPGTMSDAVGDTLVELGLERARIHIERYGAPRASRPRAARPATAAQAGESDITVIMDGHRRSFVMPRADENIVDGAARHGIDLPFSCKGGVCATCRTLLRDGEVEMDANFGLEQWEIEQGYILACQSHPRSKRIVLDYDVT